MAAKRSSPKPPQVTLVEVYRDAAGDFRWRGSTANGRIVSESGEGYNNRSYAIKMARSLNAGAQIEVQ
jgi:uncharacterized protein YegP (UPF0339 family)